LYIFDIITRKKVLSADRAAKEQRVLSAEADNTNLRV
jgi:hypothetical protein